MTTNTKIDVLAVMDEAQCDAERTYGASSKQVAELNAARVAMADLIEAAKHWRLWDYEVQSAKVNGESVYSFNELSAMREFARGLTDSALDKMA